MKIRDLNTGLIIGMAVSITIVWYAMVHAVYWLAKLFAYLGTLLVILAIVTTLGGCNWQGQRQVEYWVQAKDIIYPADMPLCYKPEAWVKVVRAEWWSMRAVWVSNGIEAYNRTQYWETGFKAGLSASDPNSIKAAGAAAGAAVKEVLTYDDNGLLY